MGLSNKREFEFELLNFECQLSQFTLRNRIWNFAVSLNGYFVFGSGDLECRVSVTGGKEKSGMLAEPGARRARGHGALDGSLSPSYNRAPFNQEGP